MYFVGDLIERDCKKIKSCYLRDKTSKKKVNCTLYKHCLKAQEYLKKMNQL
jgi:hypothetical protein